MTFKMGLILLTFSSLSFAQIHTNGGGSGPEFEPLHLVCEKLAGEVSAREKTFVESYQLKYSSEKDFNSLLKKINVNKAIRLLENPKLLGQGSLECKENNIEVLSQILKINKYVLDKGLECFEFRKRVKQIKRIEEIIKSHDKQ